MTYIYIYMSLGFKRLRHCATNRTVPGSIPGGATEFFSDIFLPTLPWPWGRLTP